ncbi:MAG: sugar transferase, partial [Pseudomonadota bacterium]|nr:sugar transferase [Pseudomonadota bacterium]
MGRNLNFLMSLILIIIFLIPMVFIGLIILITSKSSPFYWSKRVGINNEIFLMPKFRTMKIDTPQVATHLLQDPNTHFLPFGQFLRKFSLDELPQLISIFKGDM